MPSIFQQIFEKLTKKAPEPQPAPPAAPVAPPSPPPPTPPPPVTDVSANGVELIKSFEGCVLKAYPDPATNGDPWTIGYGHTGPDVVKGKVITKDEAEDILRKDLQKFVKGVFAACKRKPTQGQLDAMVSLAFNIGLTNFSKSTLVRLFNEGDVEGAAAQFDRWNKAAGKVMVGLTRRRAAERKCFEDDHLELEALRRYISQLIVH